MFHRNEWNMHFSHAEKKNRIQTLTFFGFKNIMSSREVMLGRSNIDSVNIRSHSSRVQKKSSAKISTWGTLDRRDHKKKTNMMKQPSRKTGGSHTPRELRVSNIGISYENHYHKT